MSDLVGNQSSGVQKLHAAIQRGQDNFGVSLMTHCVVGYPDLSMNDAQVDALVGAGAELMELQFPFSDPLADGPVLTAANQAAVNKGVRVDDGLELAKRVALRHPNAAFIVMTYFNIVFKRGLETFANELADAGVAGVIIPDLPIELAQEWNAATAQAGIATVYLVTPHAPDERIAEISSSATGFVYCIGRPGVSGSGTAFDDEMKTFVNHVRKVSAVPVGVGFGVRTKDDVKAVGAMADMAIICTEVIRRVDADGISGAAQYLESLRG